MRKLATVRKVTDIKPLQDADKICLYSVDGWNVIDQKGKYNIGDRVVYFEIDSFLPIKPEFEFLRKTSYKKLIDGREGFRLRTIKLRGQYSQGLIMPVPNNPNFNYNSGDDCSEYFEVTKYEPPIPAELNGEVEGLFPSFIPKTDEVRVQNLDEKDFIGKPAYVTEKLDGTSATFFYKDGVFGACSRNYQLKFKETNTFFKVAKELDLENKLKSLGKNIAVQGELIGPGIQGNIYKLSKPEVRFFTAFDIDKQERLNSTDFVDTVSVKLGLKIVPYLEELKSLPNASKLLEAADGNSALNSNSRREGFVIRGVEENFSFKVISNKFLLKHDS